MSQDFDNFPLYDPIIKENTNYLAGTWVSSLATFMQTLQGYLSQNGIFIPQLTTDQRNALSNVMNGQLIYNTTTNKAQVYENGAWVNIV